MSEAWYIVKQTNGQCQIVSAQDTTTEPDILAPSNTSIDEQAEPQQWGPFASKAEAIARRVGLIRAGKCEPQ